MDEQISLLVIDDDRMVRQILESALSQRGFEVHTAEDGPTGVTIAREQQVDVILLDWMMPGMDGIQVLNMLKHSEETRHIPVFMLTGKEDQGDITEGQAMNILQGTSQESTTWSVVYNLSTGRIGLAMGKHYDQVHTFEFSMENQI